MGELKLFLLGPPRLERAGETVTTDTRKATALAARLALDGERLSRDTLAAFLWPDADERRARAALRRTLSDLKKTAGAEALLIARDALGLNLGAVWCDALVFEAALAAVRDHVHAHTPCDGCRQNLEMAVTLYRDDFLAGFSLRDSGPFDDWQMQQAEHYRRELGEALQQLLEAMVADGALEEALPVSQRWLVLDPLREEAQRQLMRLYAWTGRRTAALRQYRDCVRVLEEELGVSPLEETTALYQQIQDGSLPPPPAPLAPPGAPETVAEAPQGNALMPGFALSVLPFLGREAELEAMTTFYASVESASRFLVVTGEAGIGKTRLAEAFLDQQPGAALLHGRCYPGETHLTYAPFVAALREGLRRPDAAERLAALAPSMLSEAARLLPELAASFPELPPAPPLDWPGAQGRFFEGLQAVLTALLAGEQPGILWLDDLQWADSASLELLAYLVRRGRDRPALLLGCWRTGDLSADSPLPQLLAEARRDGSGRQLPLGRLEAPVVTALVTAALGDEASGDSATLAAHLFRETEGLPFLIAAYLQSLPETAGPETWRLPPSARDLFAERLATVAETERQILQTAAVIGRACHVELLQVVSGRSAEETIDGIEHALAHLLLVEEPPESTYDFSHHKLRQLIVEDMSLARQRLLHRRAGKALAVQHGVSSEAPSEYAARIAAHYQTAGLDERAAAYYFQAGRYAESLFAQHEALDYFEAALALGYEDPAELHEIIGGLQMRLGAYGAALNSLERAASSCAPPRCPFVEHMIGQVHLRRGEWTAAEYHFEQARRAAASGDRDALALLDIDWSLAAFRAGDDARARNLAARAAGQAQSALARAQVHNLTGLLARHEGDLATAVQQFEQARVLAEDAHSLSMTITAANNLALAQTQAGKLDEARALLAEALAVNERYGDHHWEAAIRNNLADVHHLQGAEAQAMVELKAAITILAAIGREAGDWQPEIWKLSEW